MKKELTLQQRIKEKNKEIVNYTGVLERYRQKNGQGRWYNMGCRTLAGLIAEKKVLQNTFKKHLRKQMTSSPKAWVPMTSRRLLNKKGPVSSRKRTF